MPLNQARNKNKKKPGGAAEYKVDQIGTMVINPISWDITPNNYSYIYIYIHL